MCVTLCLYATANNFVVVLVFVTTNKCCCCCCFVFFLLLPLLFFGFLSFGCYLLTHVVILIMVSAINCVKRFSKNWKKKMTLCGCRDVKMRLH